MTITQMQTILHLLVTGSDWLTNWQKLCRQLSVQAWLEPGNCISRFHHYRPNAKRIYLVDRMSFQIVNLSTLPVFIILEIMSAIPFISIP
jgi:hypothetical protein